MNLLRFVATLLLISIPCLAQQVDYRALGTNSFFTNGLRVDSRHWTNETDATVSYMRPVDQARSLAHVQTSSNYYGFYQELLNTNNQTFTVTHFMVNKSTNSGAKGPYYWDGAYGGLFESDPEIGIVKAGDGVGVLGVSDSLWSRQIGAAGYAESAANNQTNVGVTAIASSHGFTGTTRVGLYAETGDQTRALVTDAVLTNSVIQANSRSGDWLFIGQTNNESKIRLRSDGAAFIGEYASDGFVFNDFSTLYFPGVYTYSSSNEAPIVGFSYYATPDTDITTYGILSGRVSSDGSQAFINLDSDNGPERRVVTLSSATGQSPFLYRSNNVTRLRANEQGDLDVIKGLAYLWPTSYGAETNYVLTDTNKAGSLSWQPGLLSPTGTNIIRSIATNAVSATAIGPGTNNWIAKFNVVGGTNVGNSAIFSDKTNLVELRQRPDGGDFNSAFTNNIFGRETVGGDTNWLQIIAGSTGSGEVHHIRAMATGAANQRLPIYLNDSWIVEPPSNQLVGHGAGYLLPLVTDAYLLGTSSSIIRGATFGSAGVTITSATPLTQPVLRLIGDGGVSGTANSVSFHRPTTGLTAAFTRENNLFLFDLSGNTVAFGNGISNSSQYIGNSGIASRIQVGTNSGVVAPSPAGIMAGQASGLNFGGSDLTLAGGPSTGTGTNGNVRIQTAEKALASSSSLNSSFKDRIFVIADPMILTTNVATTVVNITIPTDLRGVGGTVHAHTEIENGVDIATVDETFTFTANRKGITVVTGISAPITCTSSSGGSAAIANTWTAVANSTSVDLKLTCVTSGINSTNSTVRITLIPNSSAIPVITHP